MAQVITAHKDNIDEIVSHLAQNKVIAMPYGKKERRVFALLGLANDQVVQRMKDIKGREASQGVAISGIPDVAPLVAELDQTPALVSAANHLKIAPQEIVERCFQVGAIGLILKAQEWLPKGATMVNKKGERTILIAGEASDEESDIFPRVYRELIKKHKQVLVGTSANLHGEDTYHILQQDEALEKLNPHVDVFVYDKTKIGVFPLFKHLTSTTMIDLTDDKPKVVRWGNIHPFRFKNIFPELIFKSKELKHYKGKERLHHILLKHLFSSIAQLRPFK